MTSFLEKRGNSDKNETQLLNTKMQLPTFLGLTYFDPTIKFVPLSLRIDIYGIKYKKYLGEKC